MSMPIRVTDCGVLAVWSPPSQVAEGENANRLEQVVAGLFEQFRDPMLRYLSTLGLGQVRYIYPDVRDGFDSMASPKESIP